VDDARSADENAGLSPAVVRRVERLWVGEEDRRRVCEALATYGREDYEREADRVRLAILKVGEGTVEQVLTLVSTAKQDFRDVLMWAEYPEQGRADWSRRMELTQAEKDRLAEIRLRDRQQYEKWLKESEE
jgi:hypothetical protein